jgi:hypothetical protein
MFGVFDNDFVDLLVKTQIIVRRKSGWKLRRFNGSFILIHIVNELKNKRKEAQFDKRINAAKYYDQLNATKLLINRRDRDYLMYTRKSVDYAKHHKFLQL